MSWLKSKKHLILICFAFSFYLQAKNVTNDSFSKAKSMLEKKVYLTPQQRVTIYCDAKFSKNKEISLPAKFPTNKYAKRAKKMEWEHVVPADKFGQEFKSWMRGDTACVTAKGIHYKGRRCASKVSEEYKYMQADMYNLYPAIGAVNAMRSDYDFKDSVAGSTRLGTCAMHINHHFAEPPKLARGEIARSYLYMDSNYSHYTMTKKQRRLMQAWNKKFPAGKWECKRGQRIQKLQKNNNEVLITSCAIHS